MTTKVNPTAPNPATASSTPSACRSRLMATATIPSQSTEIKAGAVHRPGADRVVFRASAAWRAGSRGFTGDREAAAGRRGIAPRLRQPEREGRPAIGVIAGRDPARLLLEDLGGQVEPVTRPLVARREERLEDAAQERLGDPGAVVDDVDR